MNKKSFFIFAVAIAASFFSACCIKHEWQEATCTEPVTCEKCGETEGEALGHEWSDATCTVPKTCSKCGATEGKALGHDWTEATCVVAKTCNRCNTTEGEALGHDWAVATCDTPETCKNCSLTQGDVLEHQWNDPTCTDPYICSLCGKTQGEALGHGWRDATLQEPATCMYCGVTEGKPLTIEEYFELYPAMTIYIDYVLQASISQNTAVLEGYEWYVDGNTIEYVIYYQPAFEPYIDELRNGMLSLDWKTVLEMEYTAFENLYSVRPERIILTYAIGDVIIYSSYESGY